MGLAITSFVQLPPDDNDLEGVAGSLSNPPDPPTPAPGRCGVPTSEPPDPRRDEAGRGASLDRITCRQPPVQVGTWPAHWTSDEKHDTY